MVLLLRRRINGLIKERIAVGFRSNFNYHNERRDLNNKRTEMPHGRTELVLRQ